MNSEPAISIVISTKGRPCELMQCITSIQNQNKKPGEILIIDAGDAPLSEDFFRRFKRDLIVEHIPAKVGLTKARNLGISKAKGDIILFLDDDTRLEPEYLQELVRVFLSDNYHKIGGVSGHIIDPDEKKAGSFCKKIQFTGRKFVGTIFFLPVERNGFFQPAGFPTSLPSGIPNILKVQCLYGANMAFRKEILTKFQFDEQLTGYCFMEDDDIAYRISRQYQNIYTPFARLHHFESPVSREGDAIRKKMLVINYHYLFIKNIPGTIPRKIIFWWSILGLIITDFIKVNPEGLRGIVMGILKIQKISSSSGAKP